MEENKLKYPLTPKRYTVFFIDVLVVLLVMYIIGVIVGGINDLIFIKKYLIFVSVGVTYEIISSFLGSTLGQLIMNIRVRTFPNEKAKLSVVNVIKRAFLKYAIGFVSAITLNSANKNRALHDKTANSIVVYGDKPQIYNIITNQKFKFGYALVIYLLITLWLWNFWLLLGLPILYDIYITKKVNWSFWKKRGVEKHTVLAEWSDAIIFAVVAATLIRMFFIEAFTIPTPSMEKSLLVGDYLFVSKVSYGPRLPNTPLSFPFAHHTMPLTTETPSYLEWIYWPYKRLIGLGTVNRYDCTVFNFPEGDTVCLKMQNRSYYELCRENGRKKVLSNNKKFGDIVVRPVDKKENYIKRCVGTPGDTIEVFHNQLKVNGVNNELVDYVQYFYIIQTNGTLIKDELFDELDVRHEHRQPFRGTTTYAIPLTTKRAKYLNSLSFIKSVNLDEQPANVYHPEIFPNNPKFTWTRDNFGPLVIPKAGVTIDLTIDNLPLYKRLISIYETNDLKVKGNKIFINGEETDKYTFKMNYYWLMGDNRHNSADSRYWGFVPEDHVVGKAVFIWFSTDKEKSFFKGIRWNRMFSFVE